jgi:N-acetylglucosamine-6-phosphate deacetylase
MEPRENKGWEDGATECEDMVVKGIHYATGEAVAIRIRQERIAGIEPLEADNLEREALPWLAPGIVDLQVNGFRGLDFNTMPLKPETVLEITEYLLSAGVITYCPTLITNSNEATATLAAAIAEAARRYPVVRQGLAGIHLEGPFISPEDGPRGAHPREYVCPPDWELFCRWQEAAEGNIRIVTLSPEWPDASSFISRCADSGVMSTHLGNGAHLTLPRHPNYIWEQLAQEELYTCMIADGFHLPLSVLKVIMKIKGKRTILVSDAVSLSGMSPGIYDLHIGGRVVLTPEGRLHLEGEPGLLAGSVKLPTQQIAHLLQHGLAALPEAWDQASVTPAELLGLPAAAGLSTGAPADLAVFRIEGGAIRMIQTYKLGKPCITAREGETLS